MTANAEKFRFDDFTRENYRRLLDLAGSNYAFRIYHNFDPQERFILWRHDVDFSPQAAMKLAEIEAAEGVQSTYFVCLHSEFYNLLDADCTRCVKACLSLGHDIGIHFDSDYYGLMSEQQLEDRLDWERNLLEDLFAAEVKAFSFHNPTESTLGCDKWSYAGVINTYAHYFRSKVGYCSDSNGYWRFSRLEDVLRSGEHEALQVLTHAGWWQTQAMSPHDRIERCIRGRADRTRALYQSTLAASGRQDVRKQ